MNALPGLATGGVTFGSFNKLAKITPDVLAAWAQDPGPHSQLAIADIGRSQPTRPGPRMRSVFAAAGVAGERLEFVGKRPRREYLQLHHQVDIALDTFPFNGHTTVCEALWMGVPVVVLAGATYVSRFGGSALVNLDLPELIANSPEAVYRDRRATGRGHGSLAIVAGGPARADAGFAAIGRRGLCAAVWKRPIGGCGRLWCSEAS